MKSGTARLMAAVAGVIVSLVSFTEVTASTLTLQQGLNGYTGTVDTTIFRELPGNSAGGFPWTFAGMTQFSDPRRTLIKFDLAGALPPGATVTSASLVLYMDRTRPGDIPCQLHRLTRSWNEGNNPLPLGSEGGTGAPAQPGDTTWSHVSYNTTPWATAGGEYLSTPSGAGTAGGIGTFLALTGAGMVNDVTTWLADPSTNHGWILLAGESGTWNARRFISSESTDARRPSLQIEYSAASSVDTWQLYE